MVSFHLELTKSEIGGKILDGGYYAQCLPLGNAIGSLMGVKRPWHVRNYMSVLHLTVPLAQSCTQTISTGVAHQS